MLYIFVPFFTDGLFATITHARRSTISIAQKFNIPNAVIMT